MKSRLATLLTIVRAVALCLLGEELGRSMLRHYKGVGAGVVLAQEAVIAPAENLVVEGVPAIPGSLVETAGRYGSYRSATLADWSPIGREMLIATRVADTARLHLVNMPGMVMREGDRRRDDLRTDVE